MSGQSRLAIYRRLMSYRIADFAVRDGLPTLRPASTKSSLEDEHLMPAPFSPDVAVRGLPFVFTVRR